MAVHHVIWPRHFTILKAESRLTIERMVELVRVSRSGFYRFNDNDLNPDPDMDLRDAIQKGRFEFLTQFPSTASAD